MSCRWSGTQSPRMLRSHLEDCHDHETCPGCQPCRQPHCRVCGKEHVDQHETACPECVGEVRDDLQAIARRCNELPPEAIIRGVDSEAMSLLGPTADPEAWGHLTTSLNVGRLPAGYLTCGRCANPYPCEKHADHELHPLFVLSGWEQVWRDALDHETDAPATIAEAVRYLDQQLTYMAGYEHAPFEDFAADLRACRAHLDSVLHDQNRGDMANVGCFECGAELERKLIATGFDDVWTCRRCKQTYTQAEYNLALRAKLEEEAS